MAIISASFAADFSKFERAVKEAEVTLRGFESSSTKVAGALGRMTDQFSGRKLIQEAALMARAVEEIGGVGKLTAAELQRVGATATQAIEKMRAMGVDVPDNLKAIAKAIEPIPQQLTLTAKATNLLKSSFGQMFSAFTAANLVDRAVGSLVNFGKAAVDNAGHLVDLSTKTGISTDALQEMQYAAEQTGGSLDSMTDASFKLGVNLAGGKGSVKSAVENLGLSFAALRAMRPEDQFRTVMDALSRITDVNERNRLGMELMGKTWATVSSAAVEDYAKLAAAAPKMADAQIQALDNAGDAWDRLKARMSRGVGQTLGTIALAIEALAKADEKTKHMAGGEFFPEVGPGGPRLPGGRPLAMPSPISPLEPPAADYIRDLADVQKQVGFLTAEQRKQIDAADALHISTKDLSEEMGVSERVIGAYKEQTREAKTETERLARETDKLTRAFQQNEEKAAEMQRGMIEYGRQSADELNLLRARNEALGGYVLSLEKIPPALDAIKLPKAFDEMPWNLRTAAGAGTAQAAFFENFISYAEQVPDLMTPPGKAAGNAFTRAFTSSFSSLGPDILAAIQGGGNIAKTIGSSLGLGITENLFGKDGSLTKGVGKGLTNVFGKTIGGALAGILPGIGALAGPAIEGIGKLFGKVFKSEGKEVNKQRDAWISATFGTSDNLRKLAFEAGVTDAELRKLFSVSKVKDFEAASAAVSAKLKGFTDEQAADAARLEAAIQKYGFSLEQLGPKLQQSKLDEQAKELIEDWRVLVNAGIDVATVNENMAETINEYLQNAIKLGTEVPRAMKPILERMVQQGTLTDEAGNKITDLESLGLQYSETMTQGFDRIVLKLDELISKLTGVGAEINEIPDEKIIDVTVRYHEEGRPDNIPTSQSAAFESYLHEPNLPGFQQGTKGRYLDFGAGTPVMLHGRERVVTEDEQSVASAQMTAMANAVSSLQVSLVRALRENALQVRDQTQLAIARA